MNTPNNTPLGERSLTFLIRAADQLVRAERADILASEGIRRHDLRLLRGLAGLAAKDTSEAAPTLIEDAAPWATASADAPANGTLDTDAPLGDANTGDANTGDASTGHASPETEPTPEADSTYEHHGHHSARWGRGRPGRARFGGFRLRHLLMRGWITFTDGRPAITAEGRTALTRIEDRLTASRSRIESALTPEQLIVTTDALSSIVEELGGTKRLRDVRRRRRLMQHLREGGPRHGFTPRGFGGRSMPAAHVGHSEFAGQEHGDCGRYSDARGRHGHREFRDHSEFPGHDSRDRDGYARTADRHAHRHARGGSRGHDEFRGAGEFRGHDGAGFGFGSVDGPRPNFEHDGFRNAFSADRHFRGRPAPWGHRHADDADHHDFRHGHGHRHSDGHGHGHNHGHPHSDGHRANHDGDAHHSI